MRPSDYVNGRPMVNLTTGAEIGFAYARDAAVCYRQEGERGASWVFQGMDEEARKEFDQFLLQTQHPSAYEPGTTEHRFKMFAREYAEAWGTGR